MESFGKKYGSNNNSLAFANGKVYLPNLDEKILEIIDVTNGEKLGELTIDTEKNPVSIVRANYCLYWGS